MRSALSTLTAVIVMAYAVNFVRADVPGITLSSYTFKPAGGATFSLGYTFSLNHPITITALGVLDFGGNSIASRGSMPVALYYSSPTAPNLGTTTDGFHVSSTPVAGASVLVTADDPILAPNGGPYVSGDGFRYHMLDTPITLYSDRQASTSGPVGYEIMANNLGEGYATNWVGTATYTDVNAPLKSTYSTDQPSGAVYETNTLAGTEGFGQAFFGPNFLVQTPTPEPGAMAVMALGSIALIRRR